MQIPSWKHATESVIVWRGPASTLPIVVCFMALSIATVCLFAIFASAAAQFLNLPENTCPHYLSYEDTNDGVVGVLSIPNDGSGSYELAVNGSLPFQTNQRLKIRIANYDEISVRPVSHLIYHLQFASSESFPKLTLVTFNNKVLCFAQPYQIGSRGLTNVWAMSKLDASAQIGSVGPSAPEPPRRPATDPPWRPTTEPPRRPVTEPPRPVTEPPRRPVTEPPRRPVTQPPTLATTQGTSLEPFTSSSAQHTCGVVLSSIPLIVSGEPVAESEYPWMTALYSYQNKDKTYRFLCTSSLISDKHVITAGHCVQYESILLYDIEDLVLVFGKTSLENWARGAVLGHVKKVTVHPEYQQARSGHDIVIFTLTKPVQFSTTIYPLCVWDSVGVADEGVVAGWGATSPSQRQSVLPYKLQMPVVSQDECENTHSINIGLTADYSFCAGSKNGAGPCGGDTGAGFVVKIRGRYYLKGIVSHVVSKNGAQCDLFTSILFADLANERDWITSVMKG